MHLFTDYLEPLTAWIHANPSWALVFTFIISFSESLAVIGSIIPGSVTMTAIGILAGSGVMRIDLTLVSATLGAVAGDSASYFLGYRFRHTLTHIWPFSRYPGWLNYGKDYFSRHGGKSVLIGRFIGPLRSIIPLIAGMMHMNRWQFLLANVVSAIGWAIIYVMPGVLIGAASTELSAESASRLFVLILILLVFAWLASLVLKWLIKHINIFFRQNMNRLWLWSQKHPRLNYYSTLLTPEHEMIHFPTTALVILFIASLLFSFAFTYIIFQHSWIETVNEPIRFFFQTLHTRHFISFFIIISLFINPWSLSALFLSITIYTLYHRDWRVFRYWLSLGIFCSIITFILLQDINFPSFSYPAMELTFATALFGFLILYISTRYRTVITLTIRLLLLSILFLAGVGTIYLGDNWFTSVLGAYSIGFTICVGHWIFFRRLSRFQKRSHIPIIFSCLTLFITTLIVSFYSYEASYQAHHPIPKKYLITNKEWQNQIKPLLPLYTTNRIGQRTGIFNVQFVGDITFFEKSLIAYGWKKQKLSFFYSLLHRVNGNSAEEELPLIAQLYQNKKPSLIMTYHVGEKKPFIILRLWQSNYHLHSFQQPIWIGSIHPYQTSKRRDQKEAPLEDSPELFKPLTSALTGFEIKEVYFKNKEIQTLPHAVPPVILTVKAIDENNF